MTIHSDWAKAIKSYSPDCFTAQTKTQPPYANGIIDGHIQLMGAYNVTSWEQFLQAQFVRPINRLFSGGCTTVVLMFDNRMAVPPYKGMTQHKRCNKFQEVNFSNTDTLPDQVPTPWVDYMMNRYFKDKVIAMVCERIQSLIQPGPARVLVVDFKGPPKMYTSPTECATDVHNLAPMGESDVKFVRYAHMLGDSIVYATDGDYIAIALLYYATHGIRPDNNIAIYRQEANIARPAPPGKGAPKKNKAAAASKPQPAPPQRAKTGRPMEYIHIQRVYAALLRLMQPPPDTDPAHAVTAFVTMMLLAGTDYSRGLPLVGPKKLVDMLPHILPSMLLSVHGESGSFTPSASALCEQVVHVIYRTSFQKYLPCPRVCSSTRAILQYLQRSDVSDRYKTLLPSWEQMDATCKNVCWVVHYWKDCINASPDASAPHLSGFAFDTSKSQYTWLDLVTTPDAQLVDDQDTSTAVPTAPGPAGRILTPSVCAVQQAEQLAQCRQQLTLFTSTK